MIRSIYPGWWQVAVGLLIQAISAASIFTAYSIIAASLKAEFQPSNMVLMLGITVTSLASGILSPVIGTAFDRFSVRALMLCGAILISSGFILLSFTTSMTQVVIVYALFMAVGTVLMGPIGAATLLSRWFNRRRGLAMGLASSGGAVGGLIFPPLLQALIGAYDWRHALQLYGVLLFLVAVPVIALLVSNRPADRGIAVEGSDPATMPATGNATAPVVSAASALRDPRFWLISLMLGTIFCGPMGVISNMIQIVGTVGVDAAHGAALLSILSGANFAGKLILAGILDRVNLRFTLAVMLGLIGVSMVGFFSADGFVLLVVSASVCGIASGGAVPLWSLLLSRVYGPQSIGSVMGIMTFVIMPFTLLSPPIFGWVFDRTDSYNDAFLGYLVLLAFALVCLTRLRLQRAPDSISGSA